MPGPTGATGSQGATGAGGGSPGGSNGQVQYNATGAFAGAANFTISSGNPNVTAGNKYLYNNVDVIHGDTANSSFYFGYSGLNATGAYNLTCGYGAGQSLSTGTNNIFLGYSAGNAISTGSYNVIIGPYPGSAGLNYATVIVDGLGNNVLSQLNNCISIGYRAGNITVATGQENTSVGIYAGQVLTNGYSNTLVGTNAGSNASTGAFNTHVGHSAGTAITTGGYNVFIGSDAGSNVTTGSYNTIVGGYVGTAALYDQVVLSDGAGTVVAQFDNQTRTWTNQVTTVAALPAAGTPGRRAFVTDANASTFYTVATGGGSIKVPVFDDGANWRIG